MTVLGFDVGKREGGKPREAQRQRFGHDSDTDREAERKEKEQSLNKREETSTNALEERRGEMNRYYNYLEVESSSMWPSLR